jgi:hypothetical protein
MRLFPSALLASILSVPAFAQDSCDSLTQLIIDLPLILLERSTDDLVADLYKIRLRFQCGGRSDPTAPP